MNAVETALGRRASAIFTVGGEYVEKVDEEKQQGMTVQRAKSAGKRLMVSVGGSRGDIQPFAAVSTALQQAGYQVCVCTNANHVDFLKKFGLDAIGVLYDSEKLLNEPEMREAMATSDLMKFFDGLGKANKEAFPETLAKKIKAFDDFKPDVILSHPLDFWENHALACRLGIPHITMQLQIFHPSKFITSALGEASWCNHLPFNYLTMHLFYKGEKENKSAEILQQLPDVDPYVCKSFQQYLYVQWNPIVPLLVGCSPKLFKLQPDWPADFTEKVKFTGFWVVDRQEQKARVKRKDSKFGGEALIDLVAFIEKGDPPAYMGWGSMIAVSADHMTELSVRAAMKAKVRAIILGGWAGLEASLLKDKDLIEYAEKNVMFVQTAPHEWLFPQCCVIVHHGGAGTTAASLRSGAPTIVTPCFLDQFDNGNMVQENECGVVTPQFAKVTADMLASAIIKCTSEGKIAKTCADMSKELLKEDGLGTVVDVVDRFIVEEVETGKWKSKFEEHKRAMRAYGAKEDEQPGFFGHFCRIFCSSEPNRFAAPENPGSKPPTLCCCSRN